MENANVSDRSYAAYCFGDMFVQRVAEWLRGIETDGIDSGPRASGTTATCRFSNAESFYSADTNPGCDDVSEGYAVAQYRAIE